MKTNRTSNIFCDILVKNEEGKVKVVHRRVPMSHVEWLDMAPHLTVKILKKYKVDFNYRRRDNKRNSYMSNKKERGGEK